MILRRWSFRVGAWLWILAGAGHMAGRLLASGEPRTEEEATLLRMLVDYRTDTGFGVFRSAYDLIDGQSLSLGLLFFLIGFVMLLISRNESSLPAASLRRLAGMNAVAGLALFVVGLVSLAPATTALFALLALSYGAAALARAGPEP